MKNQSIVMGLAGLLIGVLGTGLVASQAVNNNQQGMMNFMGMRENSSSQKDAVGHDEMSMADMNKELEILSGDDFDKAFIEMMIAHHEGAVDMAKLSTTRAKHAEIKQLSSDIIQAQEKEISEMTAWQQSWGYSNDESMQMMHGGH